MQAVPARERLGDSLHDELRAVWEIHGERSIFPSGDWLITRATSRMALQVVFRLACRVFGHPRHQLERWQLRTWATGVAIDTSIATGAVNWASSRSHAEHIGTLQVASILRCDIANRWTRWFRAGGSRARRWHARQIQVHHSELDYCDAAERLGWSREQRGSRYAALLYEERSHRYFER